jgi:hypothetical protein
MAKKQYTERQVECLVNWICGLEETETDIEVIRVLASLADYEHFDNMREFVSEKRRAK